MRDEHRGRRSVAALGLGWLPVLAVLGCASSPPPQGAPQPASTASQAPASSHDPARKAQLDELLGVPYEVLGDDLKATHRLAYREWTEGYDRFFVLQGRQQGIQYRSGAARTPAI
jgi:hypothetical protein